MTPDGDAAENIDEFADAGQCVSLQSIAEFKDLLFIAAPFRPTEAVLGLRGCLRLCKMNESPGSLVLRCHARNFLAAECRNQAIESGSNTWLIRATSSDGRMG
jgi:hypothetical protein